VSSSSLRTTQISTAASWRDGFPRSPQNIGLVAAPTSIGKRRVSDHRRSNSSLIHWGSSITGHRVASDCRATLHALAQPLPGTGRLALRALLERARLPTWRLWARDAAIEKKDVLKARGYAWSPGEFGRPKCWYRDVSDADRAEEVSWLRENVMGPGQAIWVLRMPARDRYSDRCCSWGERLGISLDRAADRPGRRWNGVMTADAVREGHNDTVV
jgi:hypothetical protein